MPAISRLATASSTRSPVCGSRYCPFVSTRAMSASQPCRRAVCSDVAATGAGSPVRARIAVPTPDASSVRVAVICRWGRSPCR